MNFSHRPSDPARDFCQWPYKRPVEPSKSALRQEKILFDFIKANSCHASVESTIREIQSVQGRFNTVWGLKSDGKTPSVELYFYDYNRNTRRLNSREVLDRAASNLNKNLVLDDSIDYFMWSFEIDLFHQNTIDEIDIYCNGTGGTISGGTCFRISKLGVELKNLYYFFESHNDLLAIKEQISAGPRFKGWEKFPKALLPGSLNEYIYVVSVKRFHDAVYFSRVELHHCVSLMRQLDFLPDLADYLDLHKESFHHHLFDIGIDYIDNHDGLLIPKKMAIYGII